MIAKPSEFECAVARIIAIDSRFKTEQTVFRDAPYRSVNRRARLSEAPERTDQL